jgi:regulator of protease activity HflC (stomatin/prohibitin superfamily)
MNNPFHRITTAVRQAWSGNGVNPQRETTYQHGVSQMIKPAIIFSIVLGAAYVIVTNPPFEDIPNGMVGIRTSAFNSKPTIVSQGSVFMFPGIHRMRLLDLRDQVYQPEDMRFVDSRAPLQSIEGLSIGMDINVRYALDPKKLNQIAFKLPEQIGADIVEPAVQGMIYRVVSAYSVKEIFSTKRGVIQQTLETELRKKLASDGVVLKGIQIGKVDLPEHYKRGMEAKLAEELATEKMRYTLELNEKEIKQSELIADAQKIKRQKIAEAAALEQVIAAKAQQDAMKHILPFKESQIKQKQLEAEAQKQTRIKQAEGDAKARTIEAIGEAESRQKLAEAEAYRLNLIGKANAEQMEREGTLISKHPLLIQKAMADKLSDKIQVIIAPPSTDGGLITANLLGGNK